MSWLRAAVSLLLAGAVGAALVSGGSAADPRTPAAQPGLPPPFLGTAVVGDGGLTAAIDAYGGVVDLRAGPAGRALIENPAERQAAGTVPTGTGIGPWVRVGGAALPLWRADSVRQSYLPGANVVSTVARFGAVRIRVVDAVAEAELGRVVSTEPADVEAGFAIHTVDDLECRERRRAERVALTCAVGGRSASPSAERIVTAAVRDGRRWLSRAWPLGAGAPGWAARLYRRSLLVLRALTDRGSGAVAAGARDGWAYVWPRDAGAVALAFAAAGYQPEARRVARFLLGLELSAAARFHGDGAPVAGRAAQGDAAGWTAVAARAAGLAGVDWPRIAWRNRADYWEGEPGDYLANALAAGARPERLTRDLHSPDSGPDSAAAWAVRPFSQPALHYAARRTLLRLAANGTRYGITPGAAWDGADPWSAPTAWSAWSLAALAADARRRGAVAVARGDRRAALRLLAALRRSATPAGVLPERVDVRSGVPRSTTPLAWSHAFAILALRELWPAQAEARR